MSKFSFTVDRSKWRCGGNNPTESNIRGKGPTLLRNEQGYQCCLGFACIAAGLTEDQVLDISTPSVLNMKGSGALLNIIDGKGHPTDFTCNAIGINDDSHMNDALREDALVKLGVKHNIDIDFIGEYNKIDTVLPTHDLHEET